MSKRIFKTLLFLILSLTVFSCSRVTKLNMAPHNFGRRAMRIVWFQVAGFTEEHLAMLRFGLSDSQKRTAMEKITCAGRFWNYNLYDIRPTPYEGFLSQVTGKKDIKNGCVDFNHVPIWRYFHLSGIQTGIFETVLDDRDSIERAWHCSEKDYHFVEDLFLWRMKASATNKRSASNIKRFHYQDKEVFVKKGIYHDKSCGGNNGQKNCFASIFNNAHSLYSRFSIKRPKHLFVVRDFSYYNALKSGKITRALEILGELEKTFAFFVYEAEKDDNMLVLLSSSSAHNIEFPSKGRKWEEFDRSGKNVIFHRSSLMSSVFAKGAGAENFCGIFEEHEILRRIFETTQKSKLNLGFLDWM